MSDYLQRYVDYIRRTGRAPLPVSVFIEDWEPNGREVLADLAKAGLIRIVKPSSPLEDDVIWLADDYSEGIPF